MPNRDGTGPMGQGSMTGRAAGYCAGNEKPKYATSGGGGRGFGGAGRGMGRGRGCGNGRGWRHNYFATGLTGCQRAITGWVFGEPPQNSPAEADILRTQLQSLERTMEIVKSRIEALDGARGPTV